jgi:hypothetical protein
MVVVTIEYIGFMSKIVGCNTESIEIINDMDNIAPQITSFLKNKYSIMQPILILVEGKNLISFIKEHKGEKITEGTCFKVMPVFSGG